MEHSGKSRNSLENSRFLEVSSTEHSRMSWNVMEQYRMLWNVIEQYRMLWNIMEK